MCASGSHDLVLEDCLVPDGESPYAAAAARWRTTDPDRGAGPHGCLSRHRRSHVRARDRHGDGPSLARQRASPAEQYSIQHAAAGMSIDLLPAAPAVSVAPWAAEFSCVGSAGDHVEQHVACDRQGLSMRRTVRQLHGDRDRGQGAGRARRRRLPGQAPPLAPLPRCGGRAVHGAAHRDPSPRVDRQRALGLPPAIETSGGAPLTRHTAARSVPSVG